MLGFLKALARNSDPITSDLAAQQVDTNHLEQVVLRHLLFWPLGLTCRELSASTGLELGSITPRMQPLVRRGLVVRDGTRVLRGYKRAIVWKAVPVQEKLL
jgi:hypothetical protein